MPGGGAAAASRHRGGAGHTTNEVGVEDVWGVGKGEMELRVHRQSYVSVLKRRLTRARRFRTLPLALCFFCLYIAAMMSRTGVTVDTNSFDRACVGCLRLCALRSLPPAVLFKSASHIVLPHSHLPPPLLPPFAALPPFLLHTTTLAASCCMYGERMQ